MIKIIIDSTHLKIFYDEATEEESIKSETILRTKFCARDKSLARDPRVLKKLMSDIRSFYNDTYNILPTGFWLYLEHYYQEAELPINVVDLRKFPSVDKEFLRKLLKDEIILNNEQPRDYQKEAVMQVIKMHGGVCSLPTASGKSLIMALLCHAYNKDNIIIMVNTLDLIEQTYSKLIEYGFSSKDVGIIQGNNTTQTRRITILSQQSYEKAFNILPRIKVIMLDEVHTTGRTDTAEKVIYAAQNASIKIGLSATPFTDNDFQTMRLYGNVGPIVYQKEIQEQIEKNFLSQTKIQIYSYNCEPIFITGHWADKYDVQRVTSKKHKANLIKAEYNIITEGDNEYGRKLIEHGDEYNHIINNETRNQKIIEIIKFYIKENKRILVIFNIIQHGEILKRFYPKGILIHGEHELEERKAAENMLRENPGTVIFSSTIWQQGKDIDVLDVVINVGGGRATSKIIQKLGRVTRKSKSTEKPIAIAIDFDDSKLSKIGNSQFRKRLATYAKLNIPLEYI